MRQILHKAAANNEVALMDIFVSPNAICDAATPARFYKSKSTRVFDISKRHVYSLGDMRSLELIAQGGGMVFYLPSPGEKIH